MMPLGIEQFRKLVALDENDPLSRFALGRALFQEGGEKALTEAVEHLRIANQKDPDHLATYHILGQALIKLDRKDEAREVLTAGCEKVKGIGEGMGRDLGPAMQDLIDSL